MFKSQQAFKLTCEKKSLLGRTNLGLLELTFGPSQGGSSVFFVFFFVLFFFCFLFFGGFRCNVWLRFVVLVRNKIREYVKIDVQC